MKNLASYGHDELPEKAKTKLSFNKMEERGISINKKLKELNAKWDGPGWGSQINDSCDFYKLPDGRVIEVYGIRTFRSPTVAFISS